MQGGGPEAQAQESEAKVDTVGRCALRVEIKSMLSQRLACQIRCCDGKHKSD